jgi:hypothetical protein
MMIIDQVFQEIPLWIFYLLTGAFVVLSVAVGFRIGLYVQKKGSFESEVPIGSIVGATLGLLAFILAFTFGMAASRFDVRKQLVLDEVNTIGTTFLRTDFLPEPQRTDSRKLLKNYVDIRTEAVTHTEKIPELLLISDALHDQLLSQLVTITLQNNDSVLLVLYVQTLNDMIDFHSKRVTVGLDYHIPSPIWLALYFVTMLTMIATGYQFGISGKSSKLIIVVMALSFSAIIMLIADLDRAREGVLKVSQKPMIELQHKLSALKL